MIKQMILVGSILENLLTAAYYSENIDDAITYEQMNEVIRKALEGFLGAKASEVKI